MRSPVRVPGRRCDPGSTRSLRLDVDSSGSASSDLDARCVQGDGDELCGLDLWLQASGTLDFVSFLPDPVVPMHRPYWVCVQQ
jgi:hypothetical protein